LDAQLSTGRWRDLSTLVKLRLNLLILATVAVGFRLGSASVFEWPLLARTLLGTLLVAGAAAAVNQIYERDTDRLMLRTRLRPLARGSLKVAPAAWLAAALAAAGLLILGQVGGLTAGVAAAALVGHAAVYTPLKRRSPLATLVGAIPGATPPLIGWAAAQNALTGGAWALFAVVFVWQVPHVLAIGWECREDYRQAGFQTLPVLDQEGRITAGQVILYTAVLFPVSFLPFALRLAGLVYLAGACVLGIGLLLASVDFARRRRRAAARRLFIVSVVYLVLICTLLVVDRIG
jgi:heme o synthase